MKKLIIPLCIAAMFAIVACNNSSSTDKKVDGQMQSAGDSSKIAVVYQCPMDCEKGKTYDQPGQCPVCGMDLEKKENKK